MIVGLFESATNTTETVVSTTLISMELSDIVFQILVAAQVHVKNIKYYRKSR